MKRVFLVFALLSTHCFGQSWSNVLTSTRAIDWTKAGLPATITYGTGGSACNGSTANCVETTTNPWTPATRVQSGSAITCANTSGDATTINNAIAAASPGSYVLINSGTCDITSNVVMRTNGVTLRGSGPQSTTLNFSGGNFQFGVCCTGVGNGPLSATSYSPGTSTVTLTGATANPVVGNLTWINQCDTGWTGTGIVSLSSQASCTSGSYSDPGTIWICGIDYPQCTFDTNPNGGHNFEQQDVMVTNVSGTCSSSCTVTFTPGMYMPNWSSTNNAQMIWQSQANVSYGMGVEDMTVQFTYATTEKFDIEDTVAFWLKGLRIIGDGVNERIAIGLAVHGLLFNNYVWAENPANLAAGISEPLVRLADSDNLLLNNIITGGICSWADGQTTGDVLAYNYCRDTETDFYISVDLDHEPFEAFKLNESNQFSQFHDDNTHGTHMMDTWFRVYAQGSDEPYITQNPWAMELDTYNRFDNVIGSALGGPQSTAYQGISSSVGNVFVMGGTAGLGQSDPLAVDGLMRWGNCDVVNAGCRFISSEVPTSTVMPAGTYPNATSFQNSVPGSHTLPCSFFLAGYTSTTCTPHSSGGTGLSWWKVCKTWNTFPTSCSAFQLQPFPAVGPDVTSGPYVDGFAYDVPSAVAHNNLPIDAALQNSFTVTASSWSNSTSTCSAGQTGVGTAPCEILTVSLASINNGSAEHIIGGFQLSGVTAGCIPASGASFTGRSDNEIWMTGSNTTKIFYALASDPGANNCAGTLKFPDVRQFDERVYQNDPAGGGGPSGAPVPWIMASAH